MALESSEKVFAFSEEVMEVWGFDRETMNCFEEGYYYLIEVSIIWYSCRKDGMYYIKTTLSFTVVLVPRGWGLDNLVLSVKCSSGFQLVTSRKVWIP